MMREGPQSAIQLTAFMFGDNCDMGDWSEQGCLAQPKAKLQLEWKGLNICHLM
jgi:hypothetical protein